VILEPDVRAAFPAEVCQANYEGGHSFMWYGHRGPLTLDVHTLFIDADVALLDAAGL